MKKPKKVNPKELLGERTKKKIEQRLGDSGFSILEQRWDKIETILHPIEVKGIMTLGSQSAIVRVSTKDGEAILKICALPNIFQGQDEAIKLAPRGTVPQIFQSFPKEEAWLMESIEGSPGKSGTFCFSEGTKVIQAFHKGSPSSRLFPLVSYHMDIARRTGNQTVLDQQSYFENLNKTKCSLVHGDAMPENIIKSSAGYRLIDPTGFVGDPSFDFATLALYSKNPIQSLNQAGKIFGLKRIFSWAWLRAYLSADQAQESGDTTEAAPLLEILPTLKKEAGLSDLGTSSHIQCQP